MWKYNQTDELYHNEWTYNNPDELYHYGVLGMRWRHRKGGYGSIGANIAGKIRYSQYRSTNKRIASDTKALNKMSKNYDWMKKNHAEQNKNKIGKLKLLSSIREHRMNKLKSKMNTLRDSIKEDKQISKELTKYESNARKKIANREAAKKILNEAKTKYKEANKQYNKDFNKATTLYGAWGPGNKERLHKSYESAKSAVKAKNAYKKAKANYKKYK